MFPRFSLRTLMLVFAVVGMTIAMVFYPAIRIARRAQALALLKANGFHLWTAEETRQNYHFVMQDYPGLLKAGSPPELFFGWQKTLYGKDGGEPRMVCVIETQELRNAQNAGTLANVSEALKLFPELRVFDSGYWPYVPVTRDDDLRRILNQVATWPELRYAGSEFLDDTWIAALPDKTPLLEFRHSQGTPLPTPAGVRMLLKKAPALEWLSLNVDSLDEQVIADIHQRAKSDRAEASRESPIQLFVRLKHGDSPPPAAQIDFLKTFTMDHELNFSGADQQPSSWELSSLAARKITLWGGNNITVRDCSRLEELNITADNMEIAACPRLQKIRGSFPANSTAGAVQIRGLPELQELALSNDRTATIEDCPKLLDLKLNRANTAGSPPTLGQAILKRSAAPRTLTIVEHQLEVDDPAAIHDLTLDAKSPGWYEPLRAFPQVRRVNIHSVPYVADNKAWAEALQLGANIERMQLSLLDYMSGQPGQIAPDLRQAKRLKILKATFNVGFEPTFVGPGDDGKPVSLLPKNLELLLLGNPYFGGGYDSRSRQRIEDFAIIKRDHPQLLVVEQSSLPRELRLRIDEARTRLSDLPDIDELRPYIAEKWKSLAPSK